MAAVELIDGRRAEAAWLHGRHLNLLTGIARPASFAHLLRRHGATIGVHRARADHQWFTAKDIAAAWVEQLVLDGYDDIEVSRTWLGRTRIFAEKGEIEREIILNPSTGEVLRDYSRHEDGTLRLPLGFEVSLDDDDDDYKSKYKKKHKDKKKAKKKSY